MKKNNNTKPEKKSKDLKGLWRGLYIVAFACMLAIGAYFHIMISSPDLGQYILGGIAEASAIYYFVRAITT